MIFIYIIFSAVLLYYTLKYGIRNGFAELEANKEDLIYYQKNLNLFEEIGNIYHIISSSQSEQVDEAKVIYNNSFDILFSGKKAKFIFEKLTEKKEQISKLSTEK
ncbi:hypothetical protein [Staphylococcus epidermidis]|uniref:hypothetical protein n=1 Tax=Staphylococcus epidermidis TaxID=1282 RepID=UPI00119DF791|nr:hypothetical protein [Staphylococcus epidermidis]MBM0811435.1 hypothetical protein [Staphylococcus epidermidis]MCG1589714.1 hypothetical protein [Staphylococcus epidermidis]MCG2103349.1 hypothetical protein [Staphylococcus epidermidis]MCG2213985.1 hypothetical protein [Staphylococcus epidermidis]